jgi:CheY-like chemotaxis protein
MAQKMVLLVEDDPDIRDIVQDVLEAEGYDVVPASHGRQALEFLNDVRDSEPPALVILDMMMPLVDGRHVLEAIRNDENLSSVPVVVMSAVAHEKPAGAAAFPTQTVFARHAVRRGPHVGGTAADSCPRLTARFARAPEARVYGPKCCGLGPVYGGASAAAGAAFSVLAAAGFTDPPADPVAEAEN